MALAVQFRWAAPNVQVSNAPQQQMVEGVKALGEGISKARDRRYLREQQDRRNKIEDEERSRRQGEEDRRKKVYGEAADLMRNNPTLAALEKSRAEVIAEIQKLEGELGLNG